MIKAIQNLPKELFKAIEIAGKYGDEAGAFTFLVGGYVRDSILGRENLDIDIVIEGDGIKLAQKVRNDLDANIIEHKRFGTATIEFPRPKKRGEAAKFKIDFASARSENYLEPAALPVVSLATIREDLFRRDFTINALAIQINRDNFGKIIDYFGGQEDLKNGIIRALHNLSFLDDPTRILRAIRFQQRLNFKIEKNTLFLLKKAIKFNIFSRLEKQRLRDELILLFKEKNPEDCIRIMNKICGLAFIYPKLKFDRKMINLLRKSQKEIEYFKNSFPAKRNLDAWLIFFMAFLQSLNPKQAKDLCDRYVFQNGITKRILSYFLLRKNIFRQLQNPKISKADIYRLLEPVSYEVIILLMSSTRKMIIKEKIANFLAIHNGIKLNVTGGDLQDLGLKPGPYFKSILTKVLRKKIEGGLTNREEELVFLKKVVKKYGRINT